MMEEYFGVQLEESIRLALPLQSIEIIIRFSPKSICPISGVASFWLGVINQKGSLLWVLDSTQFFELNTNQNLSTEHLTAVILKQKINDSQRRVALIVKTLEGVLNFSEQDLESVASPFSEQLQSLFQTTINYQYRPLSFLETTAFLQKLH